MRMEMGQVRRVLLADGEWHTVEGAWIDVEVGITGPGGEKTLGIPTLACTIGGVQTFVPVESVRAFQYKRPEGDTGLTL